MHLETGYQQTAEDRTLHRAVLTPVRKAHLATSGTLCILSNDYTALDELQSRQMFHLLTHQMPAALKNVLVQNMAFKPGQVMKIKGTVAEETCSFAFNLGKDSQEYSLHFNPRFDEHGDSQTIVCNSMSSGAWGEEHRDSEFPFELGKETKEDTRKSVPKQSQSPSAVAVRRISASKKIADML
ncbi:LEG1 protein, partial [Polypterus senegalus]